MNKCIFYILAILLSGNLRAIEYEMKADIDSIKITGFTRILLSPEIVCNLKEDYSDIRITDSRLQEIPYLLLVEPPVIQKNFFTEFKILENATTQNQKFSRLVIHNPDKKVHTEIILGLRNSEIQKEMILKGSDDQINWYIISRDYPENKSIGDDNTIEYRSLNFPPSNYKYFEISMLNKKHDPLQILNAGYFDMELAKAYYTSIPSPVLIQKDSAKSSRITMIFNEKYEISKLIWHIKGPELYQRYCSLGKYKVSGKNEYFESYGNFQLSSKYPHVWELNRFRADTLIVEIENADNFPLKITGIEAYQMNIYLITSLKTGEEYQLLFGNKELDAPEYDLKYFTDLISDGIPVIQTEKPVIIKSELKTGERTSLFFNSKFLWIVLIIVIGSLGVMSIKMIREIKNKG